MNIDLTEKLIVILKPQIEALGYILWGCEVHLQGKHSLIRIYIEHPNADQKISLNDCSRVSEQVSAVLDVADPIAHGYSLEVSSPGVDRQLFSVEQYRRFIGHNVNLRLLKPYQDRRNYAGRIQTVTDNSVTIVTNQKCIKCDSVEVTIPITNIVKANLITEF